MSLDGVESFIKAVGLESPSSWDLAKLISISGQRVPDAILAKNQDILRADVHSLWLRWFMESFCTPTRYVEDQTKNEIHIYQEALIRINELYPSETRSLRESLAAAIAKHTMLDVQRERNKGRTFATKDQKRKLIDAQATPRCWICGYEFTMPAIDSFLSRKSDHSISLPELVDIFRPRGLHPRDISIEVEHIIPVSAGGHGDDNLALSCGWCNQYKSARTSVYDVIAKTPKVRYLLGNQVRYELPHPFWTVRLLATRRTCQHIDGCDKDVTNSELFISPACRTGSPNPTNLQVFCQNHDPFSFDRFVSREFAKKVWSDRKKTMRYEI